MRAPSVDYLKIPDAINSASAAPAAPKSKPSCAEFFGMEVTTTLPEAISLLLFTAMAEMILSPRDKLTEADSVDLFVRTHRQEEDLFLPRLWILSKLKQDAIIIIHCASPGTS
jgi:hypothetical protein